jgi:hypothetical protein
LSNDLSTIATEIFFPAAALVMAVVVLFFIFLVF